MNEATKKNNNNEKNNQLKSKPHEVIRKCRGSRRGPRRKAKKNQCTHPQRSQWQQHFHDTASHSQFKHHCLCRCWSVLSVVPNTYDDSAWTLCTIRTVATHNCHLLAVVFDGLGFGSKFLQLKLELQTLLFDQSEVAFDGAPANLFLICLGQGSCELSATWLPVTVSVCVVVVKQKAVKRVLIFTVHARYFNQQTLHTRNEILFA